MQRKRCNPLVNARAKAEKVLTHRRATIILVLCAISVLFGFLAVVAGSISNVGARVVALGATAIVGLGVAWSSSKEIRQLNRDLNVAPIVEWCRLISTATLPRSAYQTWYVETSRGRRNMLNMTPLCGTSLRGRWLVLTYTLHSRLVVHADVDTRTDD
jgi:hypothetical protein